MSRSPQEEVFSSCDVLSQIMGALLKELYFCDDREASLSKPCSSGLLAWWLQLQATNKTMSSVLHQLPLRVDFSKSQLVDRYKLASQPRTTWPDDLAWQLLLCCTYPIAALRWACLLLKRRRGLCCGLELRPHAGWAWAAVCISACFKYQTSAPWTPQRLLAGRLHLMFLWEFSCTWLVRQPGLLLLF